MASKAKKDAPVKPKKPYSKNSPYWRQFEDHTGTLPKNNSRIPAKKKKKKKTDLSFRKVDLAPVEPIAGPDGLMLFKIDNTVPLPPGVRGTEDYAKLLQ